MFSLPGGLEMLIVLFVILLLFGHRLPGMMRSLGRGVVEFKQGLHDARTDSDDEVQSDEGTAGQPRKAITEK
jgi:sec-independent protein translocase protein TatA